MIYFTNCQKHRYFGSLNRLYCQKEKKKKQKQTKKQTNKYKTYQKKKTKTENKNKNKQNRKNTCLFVCHYNQTKQNNKTKLSSKKSAAYI